MKIVSVGEKYLVSCNYRGLLVVAVDKDRLAAVRKAVKIFDGIDRVKGVAA